MSKSIIFNKEVIQANAFQKSMINKLYENTVYENTIVEKIDYHSDGLSVKGYIASPKEKGNYPVLLWNRGGYKDNGALEDLTAFLILASTAVWGYVVVATQYRGNMGSDGIEDWGGNDLNDSLNMLKVAEELPNTDMGRVAIEGASRGGMTTYRALAVEHRFKCAIVHAGISDVFALETYDNRFAKLIDKITADMAPDERQRKIASLSGLYLADKFSPDCPILLLHGTADKIIPMSHSEAMANELEKQNHPYEYYTIEKGGHVSLKDGSYKKIDKLRKIWLNKYL